MIAAGLLLVGCQSQLVRKIADKVYVPVVQTNVVETASGPVSTMVTNAWKVAPRIGKGLDGARDFGFPYNELVIGGLGSLLSVGAALRGRSYKKALKATVVGFEGYRNGVKGTEIGEQLDTALIKEANQLHKNLDAANIINKVVREVT